MSTKVYEHRIVGAPFPDFSKDELRELKVTIMKQIQEALDLEDEESVGILCDAYRAVNSELYGRKSTGGLVG